MFAPLFPCLVTAQEAARFGAWEAYCAPMAGCVLGVKSGRGDTLAFIEPPVGETRLLLIPARAIPVDARIHLSADGRPLATLDPGTGWRLTETVAGPAILILLDGFGERLDRALRRQSRLLVSHPADGGKIREAPFSLNGYTDTRGYVDEE